MRPPTVGTWLVECTVGEFQLAGMRAKLLVYNPRRCPLGKICERVCVTAETIVPQKVLPGPQVWAKFPGSENLTL